MREAASSVRSAGKSRRAPLLTPGSRLELRGYAIAFIATTMAFALTVALEPMLQSTRLPLFIAAIMIVSRIGGFRAALLATALSVASVAYLFFDPAQAGSSPEGPLFGLSVLAALGVLSAWIAQPASHQAADQHTHRLELQASKLEAQAADLEVSNRELSEAVTQRRDSEKKLFERSRFLALEAEIATVVAEESSLSEVLQLSCEAVARHFNGVFARLWMYDESDQVLVQTASCGMATPFDEEFARNPIGAGLIGMIAQDRAPHLTNDVANDPRLPVREWARAEGISSFAGYPLLAGDQLLGVIATFSRERVSENALIALRSVADRIALVIQRHRAEEALKRTEDQLRQAQKMEAIGQLAGGVAHDFNNLLTVISSYSTMALEDLPETNPLHADILEIHKAAHRAAALTRQLLAFSRKQVLEPRVLDLNDIVTNLDRMLKRLIGEDIHLVLSLDKSLGFVNADPGQIEQVIINLAINARDAMPDGGRLNLETSNIELGDNQGDRHLGAAPGAYIMLAVSDTGQGMDPETLDRAFEPFFTTKEQGQGTGLGLSTVYGIIKQSGGDVWVYSEVGQGTTFKIFLPRLTESGARIPVRAVAPSGPATGTELVLLVEDEEAVRTLGARVLRDHGYEVLEAPDGASALTISDSAAPIDLVVTDVVMPKMSGRALGERLAVRHPKVRTLFISGYTDDEVVRRGMLDARTAFLQKPFTPASLASKVREVLDAK